VQARGGVRKFVFCSASNIEEDQGP